MFTTVQYLKVVDVKNWVSVFMRDFVLKYSHSNTHTH